MLFKSHTTIVFSMVTASFLWFGNSAAWSEWNLNPLRNRVKQAEKAEEPLVTDVSLASAESSITEQLDRHTEDAKNVVQRWNDGTKRFLSKTKEVLTPPKLLPFDSLALPLSKRDKTSASNSPPAPSTLAPPPGRFGLPAWLTGPAKPEPLPQKPESVNDFLALPRPE